MQRDILGEMPIDTDICNYVQRVYYELEGFKSLIVMLADLNKDEAKDKNDIYLKLLDQYQDKNAEFLLVMDEIKNMFFDINEELLDKKESTATIVDFVDEKAMFYIESHRRCNNGKI